MKIINKRIETIPPAEVTLNLFIILYQQFQRPQPGSFRNHRDNVSPYPC